MTELKSRHSGSWPAALAALTLMAAACGGAGSTPAASSAAPVAVTGSETCTATASPTGTPSASADPLQGWMDCVDTASDARVSGQAKVFWHYQQEPPTAMSGTYSLANDGGTWEGDWSGEVTADGNQVIDGLFIGGADYAGLQYRAHVEDTGDVITITGTIEPVS